MPAPPRPARRRRLLLLLRLPSPSSGGRAGWLAAQRGSPEGEALRWLAGFLAEVDRGSPRNRMPARELAITLADGACVIAAWTSLSACLLWPVAVGGRPLAVAGLAGPRRPLPPCKL
eukprot:COSAG01_NODE_31322_length_599_cov_2.808000_1_plen_116_part_10